MLLKKDLKDSDEAELPQIEKYDTNKLFNEFKRYLLKEDKKESAKKLTVNLGYKDLLSSLQKKNQCKRSKAFQLQSKHALVSRLSHSKLSVSSTRARTAQKENRNQLNASNSCIRKHNQALHNNSALSQCKFKAIKLDSESFFTKNQSQVPNQSEFSPFNENSNSFNRDQCVSSLVEIPANKTQQLQSIQETVMMVTVEEKKLHEEISSLKGSLNRLKKQVDSVNAQIIVENRNQERYKHISYLANSIQHQTDYIRCQNAKGYSTMSNRQEDTLSQMKKFRSTLRKEKDEMEVAYIENINEWVDVQEAKNLNKKREFLFKTQNPKCNIGPDRVNSNFKLSKKLINILDQLVELLKDKEETFELIKQEHCTKVRLGKIRLQFLDKEKVSILERIQMFEHKYDIKIGSIEKLILNIYHKIYAENQSLEDSCVKITQIKEETERDYQEVSQKWLLSERKSTDHCRKNNSADKHQSTAVQRNSLMLIKLASCLEMLLLKFRYMYSLALTLDLDKKAFRDSVIQIDQTFSTGMFFTHSQDKHLLTTAQRHDILNHLEFQEMINNKLGADNQSEAIREFSDLCFNDYRVGLMAHKSWVEEMLRRFKKFELGDALSVVESLIQDCEEAYESKLPVLTNLFVSCFHIVLTNKSEEGIIKNSQQRGSLFLPVGPSRKFNCLETEEESMISDTVEEPYLPSSKKIISSSSSARLQKEETVVFENDPRKIINHLESVKNKGRRKFKALDFTCEGKAYQHNENIVIPDFPQISNELFD